MGSLKELRELNRLRLLEELRRAEVADRAELARRTGLSRTTVSALVADCLSRAVIVEEPEREIANRRGRRTSRLRLNPLAGAVLGVDFGHRHVAVAVADLASTVLAERRIDLDVDGEPAAALDGACALAADVLAASGAERPRVLGVGMGLPAPIESATGTVGASSILPAWAGMRPGHELSQRLGLPARVENDANLGALGEFVYGAGRDVTDMVYVKVSTGVGAGLVLEGALHTGSAGLAGELGHVRVVENGALCRCGNRGCLETVASATALVRALEPVHGGGLTIARLLELAARDDAAATRALAEAGRFVGGALAALCTTLNPAAVVIGGDLGAGSDTLVGAIRDELTASALARTGGVPVQRAILGGRAELLGAIALALMEPAWLKGAGLVAMHGAKDVAIAGGGTVLTS
jgi:predicted NBD/HSP70 family sugar kinase